MSGKSCGINSNGERPQYMLGSNLYNRNNGNNTTAQLVSAIKQNKQDMRILQRKTEELEQSLLTQRSLEANVTRNVNVEEVEMKFRNNLDLIKGDFREQMKILKDYVKVLEQKIVDLENKIVKKTPVIPKKNDTLKKAEVVKVIAKPVEKKVEKKVEKGVEKGNVTLEIKEK